MAHKAGRQLKKLKLSNIGTGKNWDEVFGKRGFFGWAGDRLTPQMKPDWAGGGWDPWGSFLSAFSFGNRQDMLGEYGQSAIRGGKDKYNQYLSAISSAEEFPSTFKPAIAPLTDPTSVTELEHLPSDLSASFQSLISGAVTPQVEAYEKAKDLYPQLSGLTPGTDQYTEAIAGSQFGKPIQEGYESDISRLESDKLSKIREGTTSARDIQSQYEESAVQTGMAHHGGIETQRDVAEDVVTADVGSDLERILAAEKNVKSKYESDIAGLETQFETQYEDPIKNIPGQIGSNVLNIKDDFESLVEGLLGTWEGLESDWDFGTAPMPTNQFTPWLEDIKTTSPWFTEDHEDIAQSLIPKEFRG